MDCTYCHSVTAADDYMTAYVEEAGKTSLCSADSGAGCSDREKEFIAKVLKIRS